MVDMHDSIAFCNKRVFMSHCMVQCIVRLTSRSMHPGISPDYLESSEPGCIDYGFNNRLASQQIADG